MAKSSFIERNKAVREAWIKEQNLVQEGKGTRAWTPEQQKDILEKGKAYDDSGKAFEGQHMKSAEQYPEYQGEPGNIQFLTRAEHLEAHNGNWQNPTNWYFNPVTKEKIEFGDGPFIPCEIIQLPEPIIKSNIRVDTREKVLTEPAEDIKVKEAPVSKPEEYPIHKKSVNKPKPVVKQAGGLGNMVKKTFKPIVDFPKRHPILIEIVKAAGIIGLATTVDAVAKRERSGSINSSSDYSYTPSRSGNNTFDDNYTEASLDDVDTDSSVERSSPEEHMVKGHGQHYHFKDGSIRLKEKAPYQRGGNKDK